LPHWTIVQRNGGTIQATVAGEDAERALGAAQATVEALT
jgi:hypothetical protein